jgi:spastin
VASAAPQQSRRSKLDYDKDPLVQQVKNDLYIDSSELQHTTWNDIAGLAKAKQSLKESAILPLLRPDLFSGLRKPQNILLYGPPGTGKTLLVKAVAYESQCLLFSCSASTLTSKWHGEGEKLVRTLFKVAADVAPSLIFIDEMDALLSSRNDTEHEASRRFKTEFMVQMDGLTGNSSASSTNVLVVGCTNCPWNVDDAILRRFPRRIMIPLPDMEARIVLLQKLLEKAGKHSITSSRQIKQLAERLEGCSGSDISAIAAEASFGPIRSLSPSKLQSIAGQDQLRAISMQDFERAMADSTKSVSPTLLKRYADWERQQQTK